MSGIPICGFFCLGRALGLNGGERGANLRQTSEEALQKRSRLLESTANNGEDEHIKQASQLLKLSAKIMCEPTWARAYIEEGYVLAGTHNCYTCIPVIKFIEDKIEQEIKNNITSNKKQEIAEMEKQVEYQKKLIEETRQVIEVRDQLIDHLNTTVTDMQERLDSTAMDLENQGPQNNSQNITDTTETPPTQTREQGCKIVEMIFRTQVTQFRVKWRRCNTTTLQDAVDIAQGFPEETKAFLRELKENGSRQIEILYKRNTRELLNLLEK